MFFTGAVNPAPRPTHSFLERESRSPSQSRRRECLSECGSERGGGVGPPPLTRARAEQRQRAAGWVCMWSRVRARICLQVRVLREGEFESVARAMLLYYDKLYDTHLANHGGTGSGAGTRSGKKTPALYIYIYI